MITRAQETVRAISMAAPPQRQDAAVLGDQPVSDSEEALVLRIAQGEGHGPEDPVVAACLNLLRDQVISLRRG